VSVTLRFADCTLDTDARRLFRGTCEVHLQPKAFELLALLVENRSRALSKTELLERVWPGVFVSEASLARVVHEIRDAIGDRGRDGQIIRTVHAFGYAFAAAVEGEQTQAAAVMAGVGVYWLICGSREFPLNDGEHIVGRGLNAEIRLDSPKVSRRHAKFVVRGAKVTVEDLGSKNGTFVRDARISKSSPLDAGDEIRIAHFTMVLRRFTLQESTEVQVLLNRS
jgi:DNA-binding winged helix-turn-helix (wHTH) protein